MLLLGHGPLAGEANAIGNTAMDDDEQTTFSSLVPEQRFDLIGGCCLLPPKNMLKVVAYQ
jgi:hypothetical protein